MGSPDKGGLTVFVQLANNNSTPVDLKRTVFARSDAAATKSFTPVCPR